MFLLYTYILHKLISLKLNQQCIQSIHVFRKGSMSHIGDWSIILVVAMTLTMFSVRDSKDQSSLFSGVSTHLESS